MTDVPTPSDETGGQESGVSGHRARLRQRFLEGGADALPDYELLELLLCMAIPRRDVKPLAKHLIARFGSYAEVIAAPQDQLSEISGVGETVLAALKVAEASALRLGQGRVRGRPVLASWQALLDYLTMSMDFQREEQFRLLYLDKKNCLISDEVQQTGTVDHTPVYPREVMRRCLALGATAIILVHNHPSGDPTPSKGDIAMTQEIVKAATPLGISIHDHIIIGGGQHTSFKNQGYL